MGYLLRGLLWCVLQAKGGGNNTAKAELRAGKLSPELQEIESKILKNQVTKELNYPIGLVYGGATKIKQYVFESDKLAAIRGASGILDRINLVDLPAFFGCEQSDLYSQCQEAKDYCQNLRSTWLERHFPGLASVLIPELIIYSTGGNILAFCPYQYVDQLADAIEKRYTYETLTANSCAVGAVYKLYEIFLGLDNCNNINWQHPLIQANFPPGQEISKGFNQLTTQLAIRFNQRRAGNVLDNRPSRAYPPHFDTHPYIQRDTTEKRSAVIITQASLPAVSCLSEASARQFVTGQLLKRDDSYTQWYQQSELADWQPGITDDTTKPQKSILKSWVTKFTEFLSRHPEIKEKYYAGKVQLGLQRAYELLSELNDALGGVYDKYRGQIRDALATRNYSILAHGFNPITEERYKNFADCVIAFIKEGLGVCVGSKWQEAPQFISDLSLLVNL